MAGLTRHSAVPTTTVMDGGLSLRERKLIFASEWAFKPEGVAVVKERLEKVLGKHKATIQCVWDNENNVFRVVCLAGETETIFRLLNTILRDIIREEGGEGDIEVSDNGENESVISEDSEVDKEVPFKSNLIQPLASLIKDNDGSVVNKEAVVEPAISHGPDVRYPLNISPCPAKNVWSCQDGFELVTSNQTLAEICDLTGCLIHRDKNNGKIFIGAQTQETCHLVMSKLDNILQYVTSSNYTFSHVFYSEELENFKVALKKFPDVKKRYFETTLLDNLQLSTNNDYQTLVSAITVRCAIYDSNKSLYIPIKDKKYARATEETDLNVTYSHWDIYTYSPRGTAAKDPKLYADALDRQQDRQQIPRKASTATSEAQPGNQIKPTNPDINGWVGEVSAMTQFPHYSKPPSDEANQASKSNAPAKPAWDTYIPLGEGVTFKPEHFSNKPVSLLQNVGKLWALNEEREKHSQGSISISTSQTHIQQQRLPSPPTNQEQIRMSTSKVQQAIQQPNSSSMRRVNPDFTTSNFPNNTPVRRSILDDNISVVGFAPPLVPLRNTSAPLAPSHATPTASSTQASRPELSEKLTVSHMSLQSRSTVVPPKQESQQRVSEVATRKFYQTMNQKAPKPKKGYQASRGKQSNSGKKLNRGGQVNNGGQSNRGNPAFPKNHIGQYPNRLEMPNILPARDVALIDTPIQPVDPLPEFLAHVKSSFEAILKSVRRFRGEVTIQAQFGRVILGNLPTRFLTNRELDHCHEPDFLEDLLIKPGPFVYFTNVLTSVPADIRYLVYMKNTRGESMWSNNTTSWNVKYEFSCQEKEVTEYTPFDIEVDAETFVTQIKTPKKLGDIHVHGIKRHWDFQITATGNGNNRDNIKKYGELSDALQQSIWIPSGLKTPLLRFILSNDLSKRFQIDGLRVHRICRYKSVVDGSILNISEIQDLDVKSRPIPEKKIMIFDAQCNKIARKPTEKLDSWYEASISSSALNTVLEQNKLMKLGEEVGWTPEKLSRMDIAENMCLPACEMLKQMDGIGYYNDNGVDVSKPDPPRSTAPTSPSKSTKPEGPYW